MNEKQINFISCIDKSSKQFRVYNGNEWINYSSEQFDTIILTLVGYINQAIQSAITNTINLDITEFKKLYGVPLDLFLSDKGSKNEIIISIFNPLYDESINFNKTIKVMCSELFKKIKKQKKKKSKTYESDSDSDSDSDDSDDSDSDDTD
jgi:hypothetical protein